MSGDEAFYYLNEDRILKSAVLIYVNDFWSRKNGVFGKDFDRDFR